MNPEKGMKIKVYFVLLSVILTLFLAMDCYYEGLMMRCVFGKASNACGGLGVLCRG